LFERIEGTFLPTSFDENFLILKFKYVTDLAEGEARMSPVTESPGKAAAGEVATHHEEKKRLPFLCLSLSVPLSLSCVEQMARSSREENSNKKLGGGARTNLGPEKWTVQKTYDGLFKLSTFHHIKTFLHT
jgi:hypothetical protein